VGQRVEHLTLCQSCVSARLLQEFHQITHWTVCQPRAGHINVIAEDASQKRPIFRAGKTGPGNGAMMGMVIAVSLACVALGTQLLLIPVLAVDSYQLFLGAVAVSSIYGGGTAGLVTLLISGLGKLYFFMPSNVLAVDSEVAVRMLLFLAIAGVICWIGGRFHASERWLAAVLTSIGDALIATDRRGRIRFMNPAAEALSGWSEEAAVKRNLCEVIHLRDRASGSTMALHDSMPVVSVPAQDPEPSLFCGTLRSAGRRSRSVSGC